MPSAQSAAHDALGRAVRRLRRRAELSQEALGQRAELHRNYVGAIERGEINPTFRILLQLAAGLRLPPSVLMMEFEHVLLGAEQDIDAALADRRNARAIQERLHETLDQQPADGGDRS